MEDEWHPHRVYRENQQTYLDSTVVIVRSFLRRRPAQLRQGQFANSLVDTFRYLLGYICNRQPDVMVGKKDMRSSLG